MDIRCIDTQSAPKSPWAFACRGASQGHFWGEGTLKAVRGVCAGRWQSRANQWAAPACLPVTLPALYSKVNQVPIFEPQMLRDPKSKEIRCKQQVSATDSIRLARLWATMKLLYCCARVRGATTSLPGPSIHLGCTLVARLAWRVGGSGKVALWEHRRWHHVGAYSTEHAVLCGAMQVSPILHLSVRGWFQANAAEGGQCNNGGGGSWLQAVLCFAGSA